MYQMKMDDIKAFVAFMREEERSDATVQKYGRILKQLYAWLPAENCNTYTRSSKGIRR